VAWGEEGGGGGVGNGHPYDGLPHTHPHQVNTYPHSAIVRAGQQKITGGMKRDTVHLPVVRRVVLHNQQHIKREGNNRQRRLGALPPLQQVMPS
jgi:hypothetical protein